MIRLLFTIFVVLLILKLIGVAQVAWWMVIVPGVLLFLGGLFMAVMLSPYGTLITFWAMQKGHEANKRKAAKNV